MTTPTATAVPSSQPADLLFNAEKLDEVINSSSATYEDRLGVTRLTAAGAVARISAVNPRGAWATATPYAARDVVLSSSTWYIALDAHTSGATFAGDEAAHWRIFQGALSSDLASNTAGFGADLIGTEAGVSLADLLQPKPAAHTVSGKTITGSGRIFIGNGTYSNDDSGVIVGRALTGSIDTGAHGFRDESTYAASGTGLLAYAAFDAITSLTGAANYNHLRGFQARPQHAGSGSMDELAGFHAQPGHSGAGTVTNTYGLKIDNPTGAGPITNLYGIWIDPLTRGTSNFSIFSGSTALPGYHGGKWQMGTAPQISAAGFTTFGSVLSHDVSGNLVSNPNLTIISGVLSLKEATAKVLATTADLQLDSSVGLVKLGGTAPRVQAMVPVVMKNYTVATLPAAANTAYGRAFVTDANATTFASVVAGGGANGVPVYSDGTNWRIG